jgi:hypothetical protein
MFSKPFRLGVVVLGLLLVAGMGYRAYQDEHALNRARQDAAAADAAAAQTAELLLDLRASLHAYVAPGQGLPFWGKRAQETIEALRQGVVELDAVVAPSGASLSESLDGLDQLAAAERRARTYVSRGEMQLAGDVIFTEIRDLLAGATTQVQSVRGNLKRSHDQRAASLRNEQMMLAGGAIGLWIVIALLLMPTEAQQAAVKDPAQWRHELKETLKKPAPVTPEVLVAPVAPIPPPAPQIIGVATETVREVAEICADLSALSDPGALEGALDRVSSMLNATGLIVWVASNDGATLSPVATNGFDPVMVARIGRIPRDGANLTAAAYRENTPKVSPATATTPAALAVALCGPTGPAGVLSVELKAGQSADETKVALASIVAAQLSTLAMPIPAAAPEQAAELASEAEGETRRAAI